MRKAILSLVAAACMLLACGTTNATDLPGVRKEVLAFYYGWYSGNEWTRRARFTPADGTYQSTDAAMVNRQMAEAVSAGITGLIAEWRPALGHYLDAQLPLLLQAAQAHGLKVSAMLSSYVTTPVTPEMVASYLEYLVSHYGNHPAWLKVNGHPVLFVWSGGLVGLRNAQLWDQALAALRSKYPGVVVIADGQSDQNHLPQTRAAFDTLFRYGQVQQTDRKSLAEITNFTMARAKELAATTPPSKIFCWSVMPGYDDSHTPRKKPRPFVDRYNGETYRAFWRAALAVNPDWVIIVTFNEWLEGTQIEPSAEFGNSALRDTAAFARQFLAMPMRR